MLWLYPAKPLPAALPSFLTLLMVLGSTRLVFGLDVLVDDFRYMHVLFVVFHSFFFFFFFLFFFAIKLNSREISLRVSSHTHTHIFILFYGTWRKNRNLLAVNFTHSPRSLRQTFFTFFFPHYCRCSCCCCQNEKLLICHVWHKFQNSAP